MNDATDSQARTMASPWLVAAVLLVSGIVGYRLGMTHGGPTTDEQGTRAVSDSGRSAPSEARRHGSLKAFARQVNLSDLKAARDEIALRLDDYDLDEMAAYLRANAAHPRQPSWRKEFVARAIAEYLGEADPDAGLAMAEEVHNKAVRSALISGAFRRMARDDPDAAMARAAVARSDRNAAITGVVDALSRTHHARAAAFLEKHSAAVEDATKHFTRIFKNWMSRSHRDAEAYAAKHRLHKSFVTAWAETDVDAALDWAMHETEMQTNVSPFDAFGSGMLTAILDVHAKREPAQAAQLLNRLLRYDPSVFSDTVAPRFFAHDPAKAMAWAQKIPLANLHRHVCGQIHNLMVCFDLPSARAFAETLPIDVQKYILNDIDGTLVWLDTSELFARYDALGIDYSDSDSVSSETYRWSETDPVAALRFFAEKYDPVEQPHPFVEAIQELAQDDPQAAARHAEVLQGEGRLRALTAVVDEWSYLDPAAAASFVENLKNTSERVKMAGVLVDSSREQDRAKVSAWAENLSGPEGERARLMLDLTSWRTSDATISDTLPQIKAAYLALPEPERLEYRKQFSAMWNHWASLAPEEAATQAINWEIPLSKHTQYGHPLIATLQAWYQTDRSESLAWVRSLPDAPQRDQALIALALTYSSRGYRSDSRQRARLFMEIADPESRAMGIRMLGGYEADQVREFIKKTEASQ